MTSYPIVGSVAVGGMPPKFGSSYNGIGFASARQLYFANSFKTQPLLSSLENNKFSKSSYNYLGTRNAQSLQNGKPIPNNSSDMYIYRKKNLAIAQSSTKTKSETNREIKFKNYNPQDVKNAKQSCRNQGCIPSRKVVNNRVPINIGCC